MMSKETYLTPTSEAFKLHPEGTLCSSPFALIAIDDYEVDDFNFEGYFE